MNTVMQLPCQFVEQLFREIEKMSNRKIRQTSLHRRRELTDRCERSALIIARLMKLPEIQAAETVLWYVSARSEVETIPFLADAFTLHSVVAPYCVDDRLELAQIESFAELAPGAFDILEPTPEVRANSERRRTIADIDVVVTPGSAFDRTGGRLGYGKGYYDRLLTTANRERTTCIGLAFDCQIVPDLPLEAHDVRMDLVVTETDTIIA